MRYLINILNDPSNNCAFAWVVTIVGVILSGLTYVFFPAALGIVLLVSTYVLLQSWMWYYSDYVDNALGSTRPEVSKRRALFVHLRVAIAGAIAIMLIAKILTTAVGTNPNVVGYAIWLLTIPAYFLSQTIRQFSIACLREVCNFPFNLAIFMLGMTTNPGFLGTKVIRVIAVAERLFVSVTGYKAELTFLHETDEIMRGLPPYR